MIAAQMKAIEDQKNAYLLQMAQQQNWQIGRGQELAKALQNMNYAGAIMTPFGQMAASTQGLAGGFANAVQSGADAAAADQANMQGGVGTDVRNEGAGMGSVMNTELGLNPADALRAAGQGYAADAAKQPGIQAASAFQAAMMGYHPDISQFMMKEAELRAGAPQQILDLMSQRQKMRYAAQDQALQLKKYKFDQQMAVLKQRQDWALAQAKLALSQGNAERANQYLAIAEQNAQLAQQREARMAQGQAFNQQYKLQHPSGSSGGSKTNWGEVQKQMYDDLGGFVTKDPLGLKPDTKWDYQRAYKALWNKYSGVSSNKGQIRRMIAKLLKQAGFQKKRKAGGGLPGAGKAYPKVDPNTGLSTVDPLAP